MAEKDYYSFDEVLRDLKMEEDELKRLVSAGEIRAFRDQDTMRFKAADIERLKGPGEGDELDLDLDDELDLGDELDLDDGDSEELVLEDDGDEDELDLTPGRQEIDLSSGGAADAGTRRRGARAAVAAAEEPSDHPGLLFALVLGFVLLVFANFAALGAVAGRTNALTAWMTGFFS